MLMIIKLDIASEAKRIRRSLLNSLPSQFCKGLNPYQTYGGLPLKECYRRKVQSDLDKVADEELVGDWWIMHVDEDMALCLHHDLRGSIGTVLESFYRVCINPDFVLYVERPDMAVPRHRNVYDHVMHSCPDLAKKLALAGNWQIITGGL